MKLVKEHINEVVGIRPVKYVPSFKGDINLSHKNLKKLPKNLPKKITGSFYCNDNNLTSLVGSPKSVGKNFYCRNNNLTSLKGAPKWVGGNFYCRDNNIPKEEIERYFRTGAVRGVIYSNYRKYKI